MNFSKVKDHYVNYATQLLQFVIAPHKSLVHLNKRRGFFALLAGLIKQKKSYFNIE